MGAPYDWDDYQPLDTFAYEALAVSSAAVGFTAATMAAAKMALVTVESGQVRSRADGTDPTASVGTLWQIGDTFIVWGSRDLMSVKFIRVSVDAVLDVSYSK